MNLKRYMPRVFQAFWVLSLSLSLECVPNILCVLRVARVVFDTVPCAVFLVLRLLCVLQGDKKHKKEKTEKKKHRAEHKSKVKLVKQDKREEQKEEAKAKKKKTEERKEEEKKDPKGKSRRSAAEDDDATLEEVQEIKAQPVRMPALPRRAPRSTHLEVKDDRPSPCASASGSSSKSGSSNNSTSSSSGSSSTTRAPNTEYTPGFPSRKACKRDTLGIQHGVLHLELPCRAPADAIANSTKNTPGGALCTSGWVQRLEMLYCLRDGTAVLRSTRQHGLGRTGLGVAQHCGGKAEILTQCRTRNTR